MARGPRSSGRRQPARARTARASAAMAASTMRPSGRRTAPAGAGQRVEDLTGVGDLVGGRGEGLPDHRDLAGVDRGPAAQAERRPVPAGRAQALVVVQAREDRHGRRGQPGGAGGDDAADPQPVEPGLGRDPELGPQVGLAERDARDGRVAARRRTPARRRARTRAGRSAPSGSSPPGPSRSSTRSTSSGPSTLGSRSAGRVPARREHRQVGLVPRRAGTVRADGDPSRRPARPAARRPPRGPAPCAPGATASSRSRITWSAPAARALAKRSGGRRARRARRDGRGHQTTPCSRRRGDLVGGVPVPGEHRVGVGAVRPGRPAHRPRGRREPEQHVLHLQRAEHRVGHGEDRPAGLHLRVGDDAADVVDRRHRGLRLGEGREHLRRGPGGDPRADRRRPARRRARPGPRPVANQGSSRCSGWPTSRSTRSAIDCELVETATQLSSAVR